MENRFLACRTGGLAGQRALSILGSRRGSEIGYRYVASFGPRTPPIPLGATPSTPGFSKSIKTTSPLWKLLQLVGTVHLAPEKEDLTS